MRWMTFLASAATAPSPPSASPINCGRACWPTATKAACTLLRMVLLESAIRVESMATHFWTLASAGEAGASFSTPGRARLMGLS